MKRRREELSEEEFVAAVDAIVQRDFFPDLPRLREESGGDGSGSRMAPGMRLDEFLERYESEDNASYARLAERDARRAARRPVAAWAAQSERTNEERRAQAALPGAPDTLLIAWPHRAQNAMFFHPAADAGSQQKTVQRPLVVHEATRLDEAHH
jgi:hypothetical protein